MFLKKIENVEFRDLACFMINGVPIRIAPQGAPRFARAVLRFENLRVVVRPIERRSRNRGADFAGDFWTRWLKRVDGRRRGRLLLLLLPGGWSDVRCRAEYLCCDETGDCSGAAP